MSFKPVDVAELLRSHRRLSRRALLRGMAAASLIAATGLAGAQPGTGATRRRPSKLIDVHHHLFTPAMAAALRSSIAPAMLPGVERSLAEMDDGGTAVAAISYPNTDITAWPRARLSALIRRANDEAAAVRARYPDRYALFASLPMPYLDASQQELERLYQQLQVDGVLLLTSYNDRWLGDESFAPLLQQLHQRRAVVFVHPATAACCARIMPMLNPSVIEYETDTARTIASLIFSGAADRYPDIRWIFSHGGGTVPSLIERFETAERPSPAIRGKFRREPVAYLREFYYDTAQAANPVVISSLLQIVPGTQLLFGTDFPYRHAAEQSDALRAMHLAPATLDGVLWGNAHRLLPRLHS